LSVWLFRCVFLLVCWLSLSFFLFAQTKEQMRNRHEGVLKDKLDANEKKKVIVKIIICKLARVLSPFQFFSSLTVYLCRCFFVFATSSLRLWHEPLS
jgi:hypothetical protein